MKIAKHAVFMLVILFTAFSTLEAQSPYKISWEKDGYILGIGGSLAITGFFLDRSVPLLNETEIRQVSRASVNIFDRSATYKYSQTASTASDIFLGIAVTSPFLLIADQKIRNDWRTIAVMFVETWSFIGATTYLSKGTTQRIRPFVYNPDAPLEKKLSADSRKSFFSGHTTASFASAFFLSTVYTEYYPNSEWKPYILGASLLTASIVGFMRYEAGAHFPTDVIAGALVGSAIGYLIPWMHREKNNNLSISPNNQADYGFSIQVRF